MIVGLVVAVVAVVFVVLLIAAQRYIHRTLSSMTDEELIGEVRPRGVSNRAVEQELQRRGYSRVQADRNWGSDWDWRKESGPDSA
jgi:hypothetical protein